MTTCIAEPPRNNSLFLEENDKKAIQGDDAKTELELSRSPRHQSRKRSSKMMASSPYFHTSTNAVLIQGREMRSSLYFQKSPSSTYGSIQTLGPLICTWTRCSSPICQKKDGEIKSARLKICHTCHPIIQSAMTNFRQCKQFQKRLQEFVLPLDTSSLPCILQMETKIEYGVRHLCPHQCFLKAYAPSRAWVFFRKEVHGRTDEPIDDLLQGWTCHLARQHQSAPNEVLGGEECQKHRLQDEKVNITVDSGDDASWEATPNGAIHPQIEFSCSKTKKTYTSALEAMRALGLEDSKKKTKKVNTAADEKVYDESNRRERYSFDTKVSEDLVLSRIPPPYSDTPKMTRPSLSSTGRRRLWRDQRQTPTASPPLSFSALHTADGISPLGLLEELFIGDPWKLLVSAILLNRSRRPQVDYILWGFLEQWPTPQSLLATSNEATEAQSFGGNTNDHEDLRTWIQPLGLHTRRSQGLVKFCKDYLSLLDDKRVPIKVPTSPSTEHNPAFHLTREEILGLYNCGEYVADAYQIFIANHAIDSNSKVDWKNLHPKDHALMAYVEWRRSVDTGKQAAKQ